MPASFIVVPEWQGSVSARAMRLIDGAEAIRGDLPSSATHLVEVPLGPGQSLGTGVMRYSSLLHVKRALLAELAIAPTPAITIGGDCGIALAAIEHARRSVDGDDLAVVWFDAHPDLNSPETSPSGAFNGMVLRAITGEGAEGLVPDADARVSPDRIVLAGVRDLDSGEAEFIERTGMAMLDPDRLDVESLVAAVKATGARHIYVHVDLDVLDPAVIAGLDYPMPFGLDVETLTSLVSALRGGFDMVGASIAGFAPASPEDAVNDLPSILRIIGSLTRPL